MEPYVFTKNGKIYQIQFKKSNRYSSRAHFHSVDESTLILEMPMKFSESYALKYVKEHENQLIRYFRTPKQNNQSIYLFGKKHEIRYEQGYYHIEGAFSYKVEEEKKKMLKRMLYRYLDVRFPQLEKEMGVTPSYKMTIHDVKTRYGSNSKKTHTIAFSLSLVHYSYEMIDSVIIHELAHHYHFDHSDAFYQVVYQYCPNYNSLRAKMVKGEYQ